MSIVDLVQWQLLAVCGLKPWRTPSYHGYNGNALRSRMLPFLLLESEVVLENFDSSFSKRTLGR